jgi:hypothetical protein
MTTIPNAEDIIKRLNDIWRDDDHERGCAGRNYDCSCGFDSRSLETAKDAADEIERLRKALERQGDNMAFVINHVTIPNQWMEKFMRELEEDRTALDAVKER